MAIMRRRAGLTVLSRLGVLAVVLVAFGVAGLDVGQAQTRGAEVRGLVRDAQGGVLPGATVTLKNQKTGVLRTDVTDERGEYRFRQLPPGTYDVSTELTSFTPVSYEGIVLRVGFDVIRNFDLQIKTVEETVTVTAETPVIDVTQIEVTGVVTQEQIETLPIDSRNYLSLALLLPGTRAGRWRIGAAA